MEFASSGRKRIQRGSLISTAKTPRSRACAQSGLLHSVLKRQVCLFGALGFFDGEIQKSTLRIA
jgi:hypothetical protein